MLKQFLSLLSGPRRDNGDSFRLNAVGMAHPLPNGWTATTLVYGQHVPDSAVMRLERKHGGGRVNLTLCRDFGSLTVKSPHEPVLADVSDRDIAFLEAAASAALHVDIQGRYSREQSRLKIR